MTELNQVFDGDLAERVFLIASAIFVAFYAGGILLMQRTQLGPAARCFRPRPQEPRCSSLWRSPPLPADFGGPTQRMPAIARRRFHPSSCKALST